MKHNRFAARHALDSAFFLGFVLLGWVAIFIGFESSVVDRFTGKSDYTAPLVLVVHVFSFVGWMGLLTIQASLISLKRADIHRRMGILAALLIPVMVVTGIGAEIESQRFYSVTYTENLNFFVMPLATMLMFTVFSITALIRRKDSPTHKRFIILATTVILSAAYNRWWGDAIYASLGDEYAGTLIRNFAGPNILIAVAMAYDMVTRGRVHRAYLIGATLYIFVELAATAAYHSPGWPPVARAIIGI